MILDASSSVDYYHTDRHDLHSCMNAFVNLEVPSARRFNQPLRVFTAVSTALMYPFRNRPDV